MMDALWNRRRNGPDMPAWNISWLFKRTDGDCPWPLPNVWLGTSIESDEYTWRDGLPVRTGGRQRPTNRYKRFIHPIDRFRLGSSSRPDRSPQSDTSQHARLDGAKPG